MTTVETDRAVAETPAVVPPGTVPAAGRVAAHPLRLTFPRVVRSEWLKLVTLRSNRWMLLGLLGALAGVGVMAASVATGGTSAPGGANGPTFSTADPMALVMSGANFGVLLVAVLGTLVGAREYGSGLVRTTMAAVPSRWPVLAARLIAFLAALVPVVVTGVLVAFTAGMAVLSRAGEASLGWSDDGVLQVLAGQVGYLTAVGVIALAVGSLMRGIAAGLAVVIGGVLFLPTLAGALLPSGWSDVLQYLPSNAGASLTSMTVPAGYLAAGPAAAVLAGWVVAVLTLAVALLRRRDV